MDNVTFIEVEFLDRIEEIAVIENENGFISMPKSVYDEQQAALKDK